MAKVNVYGKAGNNFYKVTEHSLDGVWDYKLEGYDEIDFVEQGGGNYVLGENEIFFIKTKDEYIGEYLDRMKHTDNCNSITKNALKKVETLYVFEKIKDKFHLYIQRIMPSARVEKTYLSFNPDIKFAHIETNKINIPICNHTHLYWNQEEQKIYFAKFSDLELVFPSFSKYYREATEKDIQLFKNNEKYPFLKVQISDIESLSKRKLKTIAMIVDELEKVKNKFEEYKNYALKYKQDFIKGDKFEINNAKDIDHLADIVFRKIYTTEAGDEEIRVANSYKTIPNK
ncbi:hypothetical protein [Helicobacter turcicus]|uniref:Uncharacterized protein n=1 Tax=Helicobacter turcicus TaxID=2867412 RepID=A0ABS7JMK2_9HELI|nr:hypothetical protein [Helicobacter turcicus]MBX7490630.1 hypothetical protein [Helicobacter turcicus]MBX7545462.1 hypothetical protein [Helicobacter turcicus]